MHRKEVKELAKQSIKGNWLIIFVGILIYSAIAAAVSTLTGGIGALLLSSILIIALTRFLVEGYKRGTYEIGDMFTKLDEGLTNRIVLSVLKSIYLFLWSLLFVIPGIIKSYSYLLAEYISMKHPEKTATECIDESRLLMDGHKFEIFLFELSFLGWNLLAVCTFGLLYIWLLPYMQQARVLYIDKNIYNIIDDNIIEVLD